MSESSTRTTPAPSVPASFPSADSYRRAAWLIVGLAVLMRILWLGMKPPHFDEGVNGFFVDLMTRSGFYIYDPANYHGPFHFYVLYLAQTLFGREIIAFRLPLVLINAATVWLILQYRRFLPWRVCTLAALAFAISPAMMFYSRYAIHEAWLVFAMVLGFWGVAELWTRGTARGLWAGVMGVALMILTKETYLLHLLAFALACGTLRVLELFTPSGSEIPLQPARQRWSLAKLNAVLSVALLSILFFYSGGFLDPSSLIGLVQTFSFWSHTGVEGAGHGKEWYYWFVLMAKYEWPALIGVAFSVRALWPGMNRLSRLLAIYGGGALCAYSIVSYKTPWCIMAILWPFFFLFGDAVDTLLRACKGNPRLRWARIIAILGTIIVLAVSAAISIRLNYFRPTDPREDYVYVQSTNDLFKLTRPLEQLVAQDPAAYHLRGNLLLSEYHPLPWVLGDFTDAPPYPPDGRPSTMDAAFLVVEEARIEEAEAALTQSYFTDSFQLRDGLRPGKLYLDAEIFAPFFPGRVPEFTGKP
jgi:uncharacterized protein (TIGR03663 family)